MPVFSSTTARWSSDLSRVPSKSSSGRRREAKRAGIDDEELLLDAERQRFARSERVRNHGRSVTHSSPEMTERSSL